MRLSAELTQRLRELIPQQDAALFVTLLSGWAVLLGRWSGQEEVVIGTPVANRQHPENEPLIGFAEDTPALRVGLQEGMTVEQLLKQVGSAVAGVCTQQNAPLEQSFEPFKPVRNCSPALQLLMRLNDTSAATTASTELQLPGMKASDGHIENARTQLELSLSVGKDGLTGTLEYISDLLELETIKRMAACWQVLLEGMVTDVQQPISQLPMLTANERQQVLYGFNATAVAYRHDRLIHELFEEQVERTPDAVSVVCENQSLTYAELNSRANQLARYLRDKGVGPDQLVGIYVERSFDMVVGLLGILKAGGAYVPLDPSYPFERLAYMLRDAAPRVLLTQEQLRSTLPPTAAEVIALDNGWKAIAKRRKENLDARSLQLTSRHLAYVIYTSGSTGEPKGVAAEHRGMVNRIAAQEIIGAFSGDDICCQKTSIGFVDAIFEILGPLSYGRPLVLASAAAAKEIQQLASLIEREHITRLVTVPSLAQSLVEDFQSAKFLRSLRNWTLSGEELKAELLRKLQERLPECTFTNLYGASEVAADVTFHVSRNSEDDRVSIGRPITNTQIYILDRHQQPVPVGVAGEIYIGGSGVARGYLNRPELTAERFIADPFQDPQACLYRSGDLGRWRADGAIDYLGRADGQVKIRGFRIELGEIEAQLVRHVQVKEAVVVAREDVQGGKRLVAYVTWRGESGPRSEDLRAHLQVLLPEYMVPSAFVVLQSLPLTPSGKLDRRALPAPAFDAYVSRQYEAPQGEAEEMLARIWQELLRVERVGRQDNFFELGGHSLLIVQMTELLRRVDMFVPVRSIYERPTLAAVASTLVAEAITTFEVPPNRIPLWSEAITPQMLPLVELGAEQIERIVQLVPGGAANIQDIYPLAPLQEGMLFHHLIDGQSGDTYVMPTLLSVSSRERLKELISALQGVIDRHDILRTAVLWELLPQPVQVVYRRAILPVEEVALDSDRDPMEQIKELMKPERQQLDLRQAPLMRLQVVSDTRHGLWYALLQIHHMVDDETSLKIWISEVVSHLEGRAEALPEPVPYRNHVAQALEHTRMHDAEAFFRNKLGDIDEPTAPFGLLDVHGDGSRIKEARREFEPALTQCVRVQARHLSMSVATLFHAAWALVVARTSRRHDVVFGSVLLGRLQGSAGAQRAVGMFVNTLPLRLRLDDVTARELVQQTQRELVELLDHEQASLALAQRCSGMIGSAPLFSTVLNYRHDVIDPKAEWARAGGIRLVASQERTNYPITLSVDDFGDRFTITAQTDRRIDPHRIIGYLHTAVQSLLEALEQAPQTPALALSIVPESERHQLIKSFNATQAAYPQDKLIHQLFEEQAERTPDVIAVVYEGQRLTYAELNGKANQLAHYLREQGLQSGEYIPLVMQRCLQTLIAQLAVLKSGGVYVPLDPALPMERLAFMVRDCRARRVLAEHGVCAGLEQESMQWIDCSELIGALGDWPKANLQLQMDTPPPAYVMYTSGSTGVPKGVIVPHRAVNRLVINNGYAQIEPTDCVAHCSNPSFDASTFEVWGALLNGARLLIVPQSVVLDASRFAGVLTEQRVTVLWLTVGLFTQYTEALAAVFARLRYLLTGGDVLEPSAVRRLLRNSPPRHLLNGYGPTECTTFSTTCLIDAVDDDAKSIPIGRPISNTQIYILDNHLQPVPIGVPGEICIGGAGVATGYLNRPELTAERFLSDPFSTDAEARLYTSGDLGRWRADGSIDFLGRNDQQVKLRGFRIELGEIEAHLLQHSNVKEAIVLAREDEPGEKKLVAYIVADLSQRKALQQESSDEAGAEIVAQWKTLYEETYSVGAAGPSFVGWNSSYTGQPIPETQMQEWLAGTVERIQALRPKKVLEIGCGVGLVLQHLAPQCEVYVGTDFSAAALDRLRQWMSGRENLQHVELLHCSATELQDLEAGSFDTVVLNSVVQYFPDIDYLMTVLQEAIRLLAPSGKIFIGDVRHLGLLPMFHSAVQLSKAAASVSVGQLRRRIARAVAQDKELVIEPQFFQALLGRVPGISAVDVHQKRGRAPNELTRYRYDVVLDTGEQIRARAICEQLDWRTAVGSTSELEAALAERRWCAVRLHSIPSARLGREAAAQRLIETSDERTEASTLRRQLNELHFDEVSPERLLDLGHAYGYDVTVSWGAQDTAECCEVQLLDRARADQAPRAVSPPDAVKPWSAYANDPLENGVRQQLIPQLREYLKERLPEYMIPSAWMALKQLPLTPNGKVDRRALPTPQGRPGELGEYIAPRTEMERTLADLWAQLLRVDQVGVQDNFFELGGHSLLATQVVVRIQSSLSIEMPIRLLFEFPTVEQLSVHLDHLRQARLLDDIEDGGNEMEDLLETVAAMPESKAKELLQELTKRARP